MKQQTKRTDYVQHFYTKLINFLLTLLILLLPTQLGKHFWPKFSYVLGVRIDYLSPTLYLTDILIIAMFVLWLIQFVANSENHKKYLQKCIALIANHKLLTAFLLYLVINIVASGNIPASIYWLGKVVEYIFLFYLLTGNLADSNIKHIAFISAFPVIAESLLAIAQYLHQGSIGGLLYFMGERNFTAGTPGIANASLNGQLVLRPYGTLPHPNVLAGYLLFMLIIIYSSLKDEKNNLKKAPKIIALLMGSIALFLTLSRIIILIWITLLSIRIIMKLRKQPRYLSNKTTKVYVAISLTLVIGTLFFLRNFLLKLFFRFSQTNLSEESFLQRKDLIQNAVTLISQHPLFGLGFNNYLFALAKIRSSFSPALYLQPVHNIFLLWIAETGGIGLTFLVVFIFLISKRIILLFRRDLSQAKLSFTIFICLIIVGSFDHYLFTLQQGQLLTILMISFLSSMQGHEFRNNKH